LIKIRSPKGVGKQRVRDGGEGKGGKRRRGDAQVYPRILREDE